MPPEEAVRRARILQTAMTPIPESTLLAMQSSNPEMQKMALEQFGLAGKERAGARETAVNVLKQALGEKEAAARLEELRNTGLYQRGMLANLAAQQELARAKFPLEKMTAESEAAAREAAAAHAKVMETRQPNEKIVTQLGNLKAAEDLLGDWPVLGGAIRKLRESHEEVLRGSGFKVENGAVLPSTEVPGATPAPAGGSFAVPKAPGGGMAPAAIAPVARPTSTHYSYNPTRTKRYPVDAKGNRLGPMETSSTPWPK